MPLDNFPYLFFTVLPNTQVFLDQRYFCKIRVPALHKHMNGTEFKSRSYFLEKFTICLFLTKNEKCIILNPYNKNNSLETWYQRVRWYETQYLEWHLEIHLEISVTKYNNIQRGNFEGSFSYRIDNNGPKY